MSLIDDRWLDSCGKGKGLTRFSKLVSVIVSRITISTLSAHIRCIHRAAMIGDVSSRHYKYLDATEVLAVIREFLRGGAQQYRTVSGKPRRGHPTANLRCETSETHQQCCFLWRGYSGVDGSLSAPSEWSKRRLLAKISLKTPGTSATKWSRSLITSVLRLGVIRYFDM